MTFLLVKSLVDKQVNGCFFLVNLRKDLAMNVWRDKKGLWKEN